MTAPSNYPNSRYAGTTSYESDARMDAWELIKILRRRRTLIGGTVVLLTGLAALLAFGLSPQYTATASVVVDAQATRVVNTEAVLEEQTQDRATLETHIRLLQSRSFALEVIEQAGLMDDPAFTGTASAADPVGDVLAAALPWLMDWMPEPLVVATGLAEPVAGTDQGEPDDGPSVEAVIDHFLGGLRVAQAGDAYVLSIQYTSLEPEKAARIVNAVAEAYVARQLANKRSAASQTAAWLSERLSELREQLLESEAAIARYRAEHELLDSNGATLDSAQLTALNSELITVQAQLAERQAKLSTLRALRQNGEGFESISDVVASPVIAHLRQQQTDLLRKEAQLSQEYGPRHPKIIEVKAEQRELETKIQIEIQNIVSAFERDIAFMENRERMLRQSLSQAKSAVALNNRAEVHLRELEREAEANRTLYKAFLDRYKKLSEQQEILEPGVRVISRAAAPTEPSFPRPKLIIAVGFTGSLVIATLLAFAAESLDRGLRSGQQVEKALGIAHLGLVPQVTHLKNRLKLHQYLISKPRSAYAEAVRAVQVGLQFSNLDRPPQIILVTSSLPSEGKTTLALSLGASSAASGHKTVVVDLDLRHPSVRRELNQPATAPGLVELMTGEASLDQVTHIDDAQPNLHVITLRRNPANPVDLLASQKMAALMTQLRGRYKHIILDAPPLLGISDTRVAVHLADAVLFVVRWGETKSDVARNGMAILTECRAPVAGAVLTQVNLRSHARRAYGDAVQYYGKYKHYYLD